MGNAVNREHAPSGYCFAQTRVKHLSLEIVDESFKDEGVATKLTKVFLFSKDKRNVSHKVQVLFCDNTQARLHCICLVPSNIHFVTYPARYNYDVSEMRS